MVTKNYKAYDLLPVKRNLKFLIPLKNQIKQIILITTILTVYNMKPVVIEGVAPDIVSKPARFENWYRWDVNIKCWMWDESREKRSRDKNGKCKEW